MSSKKISHILNGMNEQVHRIERVKKTSEYDQNNMFRFTITAIHHTAHDLFEERGIIIRRYPT